MDEMTPEQIEAETLARLDNLEAPDWGELVGVRWLALDPKIVAALARNAGIYREAMGLVAAQGFTVRYWDGWEGRSASYSLARIVVPAAVINHHTAGNGTSTSYILNGDPLRGLSGPLANLHVLRDGTVWVLGVGYQNHAGNNDRACWDQIAAGTAPLDRDLIPGPDGTFSANRNAVAIEANGDGGSDDWTPEQTAVIIAINAAFAKVLGWKTPHTGAHKELTRRKPGDPVVSMGTLRSLVAKAMSPADVPITPPPPPVPASVDFRLGLWNAHSYGGSADYAGRGDWLRQMIGASILCLSECYYGAQRDTLRSRLGDSWKIWTHSTSRGPVVLWDSRKWLHLDRETVDFGDNFHGATRVALKNIVTGLILDVISVHVRPGAVATAEQKAADVAKALTLYRGRPTVIAGDFNLSSPSLPGWTRVTPRIDTLDGDGIQALDSAWIKGPGITGRYATAYEAPLSDHDGWRVGLTLAAPDLT